MLAISIKQGYKKITRFYDHATEYDQKRRMLAEKIYFLQAFFFVEFAVLGSEEKQRMIQEYVPGKQLTLAHLIANPQKSICQSLGLEEQTQGAIGILTITPGEAAIIAADVATKAADVEIGFLDRFGGALVLVGDVASVESSINNVLDVFETVLNFAITEMTRS